VLRHWLLRVRGVGSWKLREKGYEIRCVFFLKVTRVLAGGFYEV